MHYTKPDIDFLVGELSSNHYTKQESDSSLASKANQATTSTKTEVDNNLALNANRQQLVPKQKLITT